MDNFHYSHHPNLENESQEYPFLFSFVMAVYNVKSYLNEAVDSIMQQDIGFETIQIILVDDGSTDQSGDVCDTLERQYPGNIIAVHKENGGAASARNKGLEFATGQYVGFMDPDDKISKNTCSLVYRFFQEHAAETDIVSIPMTFFGAKTGPHILNYKFQKGTRVIDLRENYECIQLSLASIFVKHETACKIRLNEQLEVTEDGRCLLELFMEKPFLGVIHNAAYYYRRRANGTVSLTSGVVGRKSWYIPWIEAFAEQSIKDYQNSWGYVPEFVQYTIMYELQWRFWKEHIPDEVLTDTEKAEYRQRVYGLLAHIDDKMIRAQKHLGTVRKNLVLDCKYKEEYKRGPHVAGAMFSLRYSKWGLRQRIDFVTVSQTSITIEGRITVPKAEMRKIGVWANIDGAEVHCELFRVEDTDWFADEALSVTYGFRTRFANRDEIYCHKVKFFFLFGSDRTDCGKLNFSRYSPIGSEYRNSYCWLNGRKITVDRGTLHFARCGRRGMLQRERRLFKELWKHKKSSDRKAALARLLQLLIKPFCKKPIWILSDRLECAGDNGEALFRYINQYHNGDIDSYFVLNRDTKDYQRLKAIGHVVNSDSWKYKFLFLCADAIISSQAQDNTINPFYGFWNPYRDIINQKPFIFLQHGIIKDNLSQQLNRYQRNIRGLVVSAVAERNSINTGPYFYTLGNLWLTGLPRYDLLHHDEKRRVVIMPTWRRYLLDKQDPKTGIWEKNAAFDSSAYVQFYQDLLHDERLLSAAEAFGYSLSFFPHPNIQPHIEAFNVPKDVMTPATGETYCEVLAQSDLLITDYSSVAMDFAYLRKPVLYCHFDREEFEQGDHIYTPGYFDYEKDGFGEVVYNRDALVDAIISYMETGCQLKQLYRERMDQFFFYNDQNNCARIYEKIRDEL